mmetsp:Transcript_56564/g.132744  ORF Transcript_56564/g.132744 Transcript_56564/m.132744 type:complete len:256 (+) Transcript_56564:54-821(+)
MSHINGPISMLRSTGLRKTGDDVIPGCFCAGSRFPPEAGPDEVVAWQIQAAGTAEGQHCIQLGVQPAQLLGRHRPNLPISSTVFREHEDAFSPDYGGSFKVLQHVNSDHHCLVCVCRRQRPQRACLSKHLCEDVHGLKWSCPASFLHKRGGIVQQKRRASGLHGALHTELLRCTACESQLGAQDRLVRWAQAMKLLHDFCTVSLGHHCQANLRDCPGTCGSRTREAQLRPTPKEVVLIDLCLGLRPKLPNDRERV